MTILSTENLGRRVGDRWLWRALALRVGAGECLGVVGASGSGKTLLLRTLARLDLPTEGEVRLDGRPADDWPAPEYRARVLYAHQRPELLEGTVEENLRAVFALHVRRGRTFDRQEAVLLLDQLGRTPALLDQRVSHLSGGERQSVALARAILAAPEVLLLDEPTAALDAALARAAEAVVAQWRAGGDRRACLWVSHDPEQIARVADRRLALEHGDA